MKNEIMGLQCTTRKGYQTRQRRGNLALTVVRQQAIMFLWLDNKEKETYDCGASQTIHLRPGMDTTGTKEKARKALSLCSSKGKEQPEGRVEIHCSSLESRVSDRGADTRETRTSQKIKPAPWLATIEKSAVRFLSLVFQAADKNLWYRLLIFSIHRLLPYGKVCS